LQPSDTFTRLKIHQQWYIYSPENVYDSCKCRPPLEKANSALPNPLAGFARPLHGGERWKEKKRKGGEGKRKNTSN